MYLRFDVYQKGKEIIIMTKLKLDKRPVFD